MLNASVAISSLRRLILETAFNAKEGHVPSALSILDILYVLYEDTLQPEDRFILSKGHGCLALYAVLYPKGVLSTFCQPGGLLGHPTRCSEWGIHATTGSLGHGLPIAAGMALAKKIKNEPGQVFCLVGDGELEEGACLETLHLARRLQLHNLTCIVDANNTSPNRLDGTNFASDLGFKFAAFGWFVMRIGGHDHKQLASALLGSGGAYPKVVIANTIKGKGIVEMEADPAAWHRRVPLPEMLSR